MSQRCDGRATHSVPEIVFESSQSLTFTAAAGEGRARISGTRCTCALQVLRGGNDSFFQPFGKRLQAPRSRERRSHSALTLHRLPKLSVHIRQPTKTHTWRVDLTQGDLMYRSSDSPGHVIEGQIISVVQRRPPAGVNSDLHPRAHVPHSLLHVQLL